MSIGVSGVSEATTLSAQQVIDDADQNLYQAKKTGRNRVFVGGRLAAPAADASFEGMEISSHFASSETSTACRCSRLMAAGTRAKSPAFSS